MTKRIISTVLLSLLSVGVHAEGYLGATIGQAKFDDIDFDAKAFGSSQSTSFDLDEESLVGSIYGGYNFNRYIAIEATLGGIDSIDKKLMSVGDMVYFSIQPKLSLPITSNFSIFAKAGLAYFNAETIISNSFVGSASNTTISDSVVTGMFGLGAEYAFSDHWRVRATWDYMRPELELAKFPGVSVTAEPDIHIMSVGMSYHF
ncbi:outer membrane beta-barrel protein [Vibrio aestuarianus]|uniref:Outer membrane beta-barrel protein n=1 Tax=Vibrio aestuarianus TaxID=28171 RepID=A0ABD7YRM2_9VIBR|nr:outer membrane beta-barrel protein [Vibrio aestuarianus]MDE1230005.1 outer membrane beta-barrel protein [Vibrio aestuarianus]WGK87597.1 outer membrane beta-barrel protein [Vibrio aestuarianus]CAH8229799.1 Outer membrane protein [Vibrio aestuarianus]